MPTLGIISILCVIGCLTLVGINQVWKPKGNIAIFGTLLYAAMLAIAFTSIAIHVAETLL